MDLHMTPGIWEISHAELTIRIVSALIIGGLIGLEREWGDHAAGFRTHILVCLGSALIMLLSIYGFSQFAYEANVRMDPARLAAQVISGIGFLGAGTILRTGLSISGLTTAASLWVVAALGLAVGAGFYYGALLTAFLVLVSLFLLNKLEKYFTRNRKHIELGLAMTDGPSCLQTVIARMEQYGATITQISTDSQAEDHEASLVNLRLNLKVDKFKKIPYLLDDLRTTEGVVKVDYQYIATKALKKPKDSKGKLEAAG
ncbi:MgtC/SapB family protein [Paenibacillus pasadenensis]|uniref:MgtC/SapB family protein n=1 Tax=Paenibacillus pasadenensis TaxID=217090 RepID=UPI00203BB698|nr:MgtC/SapB family protein [Paenibacillus pasadenensis]MCM3749985.1 MgtC/SapB family protein [Paenibacillus pasadenensis]